MKNTGDGPLTIVSATVDSGAYFTVTPSQSLSAPVNPNQSISFTITPKTIGADVTGPSDLGSG